MITIKAHGSYKKTFSYLERLKELFKLGELDRYGKRGVDALATATPKDTGLTASSWKYQIVRDNRKVRIEWYNENVNDGVTIAIVLQYGHRTRDGGWVEGLDYINPALKEVFEDILISIEREARAL